MAKKKVDKKKKKTKKKPVNIEKMIDKMQDIVDEATEQAEKFDNGNMSAAARVRKQMQEMKILAQDVRITVQEIKNAGK